MARLSPPQTGPFSFLAYTDRCETGAAGWRWRLALPCDNAASWRTSIDVTALRVIRSGQRCPGGDAGCWKSCDERL